MFIQQQVRRVSNVYHEFPRHFWTLIGARFVDMLGGALMFPFFTLYITSKFGLSMTQVGLIFGVFSVSSIIGSTVGGVLADRIGRKTMVIFGLVMSAITVLIIGLAEDVRLFYFAAGFIGLFANAGGPAGQAMIADLLPEEKRAQGFGIFRVVHNLAAALGPAIGGFIATRSYLLLFVADAVTSIITAILVFFLLPETKPETPEVHHEVPSRQSLGGYGQILRDSKYMLFLLANMLMALVYMQMSGTLAVFLRDFHGVLEQRFSYIVTLNAGMVVALQFAITRRIEKRPPFLMMTFGTAMLVIGFSMYGFVSLYALFMVAMAIITFGEMLVAPVGQALATRHAPKDMRGRYMAFYGFSWTIPNMIGITLAGLIMDNFDPRLVWYAAGIVGIVATLVFLGMHYQEMRAMIAAPQNASDATEEPKKPSPTMVETL